jgi:hypothetical protein
MPRKNIIDDQSLDLRLLEGPRGRAGRHGARGRFGNERQAELYQVGPVPNIFKVPAS